MEDLTRNDARDKFKDSGLSYKDLGSKEIGLLYQTLTTELNKSNKLEITLDKKASFVYDPEQGALVKGMFRVSSFYFDGREAISFNPDGFIGFAGWADHNNVQPILRAFVSWVGDLVSSTKNV